MSTLSASYNLWLVGLSIAVGVVAAFGAYTSARLLALADPRIAPAWVLVGGFTMGVGIWTLHFVAMLAYELSIPLGYDGLLTFLSLVCAVVASITALYLLYARPFLEGLRVVTAACLGTGIGAMHYTGMAAMEMDATMHYKALLVTASLACGAILSYASLVVAYPAALLREESMPEPRRVPTAAATLGMAVAGLHYIGMAALTLQPAPGTASPVPIDNTVMAVLATAGMLLITITMLWLGALSQWQRTRGKLVESDRMLATLVAHLPVMVFRGVGPHLDRLLYVSEGAEHLTGYEAAAFRQGTATYDDLVVDADRNGLLHKRDQPPGHRYTVAYRITRKDGEVRWIREHATVIPREGDSPILEGFAEDVTDRKRIEEHLRQRATQDHLTGALNRFRGETLLDEEMRRASRMDYPLSLMMLDVDHFKRINDRHGHDAGDRVLRQIATLIQGRIRCSDSSARWGGEEFLIVLPGTDLNGAQRFAESLRQAIPEQTFSVPGNVTVSIGVAQYEPGETLRKLTIRADNALYAAKENGRDRVAALAAA